MVNQIVRFCRDHPIFIIVPLISILLAIWLAFGRISLFHTSHYRGLYSTTVYPLTGNAKIIQEFKSEYPGLYRIDIFFKKQGHRDQGEVILHLKDTCDAPDDLETFVIQSSEIVDGEFYPFSFAPIDDSINRRFCMMLEMRASENPTQLGIYASHIDAYLEGVTRYEANTIPEQGNSAFPEANDEVRGDSLTYFIWLPIVAKNESSLANFQFDIGFQLYYNGLALTTIKVFLTRLSAYKPYLFGTPWFYIFLFVVYFVGLILLWFLVFNTRFRSKL